MGRDLLSNYPIPLSWLGLWLAWVLGSGLYGSGSWLDALVSRSALGDLHSRFRGGVWTVDFSVAVLRLVFLALF